MVIKGTIYQNLSVVVYLR